MKSLLIDTMIFEVTPTMLAEAKSEHGRFLVDGVLQRANAIKPKWTSISKRYIKKRSY